MATLGVALVAPTVADAAKTAQWRPFARLPGTIDLTQPRQDGRVVVSTQGRLGLLRPGRALVPFSRMPGGYATAPPGPAGNEPYIALTLERRVSGAGCAFQRDEVVALEPMGRVGVIRVDTARRARRLADLPAKELPSGIAFDTVGTFGHRVIVAAITSDRRKANLYAVDCRGRVRTVAAGIPKVEGGVVVAPRSFGRFGGQLIAPDEHSGQIFAINARGGVRLVARSGLAVGADVGIEALGFVPMDFDDRWVALMADRYFAASSRPGTNTVLGLSGRELRLAGVRSGDLLGAAEGGGQPTIAVRCGRLACSVRRVAMTPAISHPEGHIVMAQR